LERKKKSPEKEPKKGKKKRKEEGKNISTPKCTGLQFLDTQFQLSTVKKLRDLEREREREREMEGGREGFKFVNKKGMVGGLIGGCILNKFVIKPAEFQGQAGARDLGEDR
jgi:hypothetical protein